MMLKVMKDLVKFTKKIFDKGFTELADVPFNKPSNHDKATASFIKTQKL